MERNQQDDENGLRVFEMVSRDDKLFPGAPVIALEYYRFLTRT